MELVQGLIRKVKRLDVRPYLSREFGHQLGCRVGIQIIDQCIDLSPLRSQQPYQIGDIGPFIHDFPSCYLPKGFLVGPTPESVAHLP